MVDSADLYVLADKVDSFKKSVAGQLAAMHTYLTTERGIELTTDGEVKVTHTEPQSQADPVSVDFDTLLEGLAASQSIPLESFDYGYPDGTKLYRAQDGKLTTDSSGQEINIAAATAESLSAGRAAWVDGELLLGSGTDNQAYYNSGYSKGHTAGYNTGHTAGYNAGYANGNKKNVQNITGSGVLNFKPNNGWTVDRTYTLKKGYLYLTLITSTHSGRWCFAKGSASINGSGISFTTGFSSAGPEGDGTNLGPTGQYQYSSLIPVNEGDVLTIHFENQITNVTLCSYHFNGINIY